MAAEAELSDLEMIRSPDRWPAWPVLPMKRRTDGRPDTGLITADYPHILIALNIWQVDRAKLVIHQLANDGAVIAAGENITTVYDSVQAMLDDGWVVD